VTKVQTRDGEFAVESALVHPKKEKAFCQDQIKELEKEKARLVKELEKSRAAKTVTLSIQVLDDKGKPKPIKAPDGSEHEAIVFDDVEGDTVAGLLADAAVSLRNNLGSRKNETVRFGALIHTVDKQIMAYKQRISKAQVHIDEENRRMNDGS
jgi:predicted  nucleic acid-binding Zn-ribbon protein